MKKPKKILIKKLNEGFESRKDNITGRDVAFLASQIGVQFFDSRNPKFID